MDLNEQRNYFYSSFFNGSTIERLRGMSTLKIPNSPNYWYCNFQRGLDYQNPCSLLGIGEKNNYIKNNFDFFLPNSWYYGQKAVKVIIISIKEERKNISRIIAINITNVYFKIFRTKALRKTNVYKKTARINPRRWKFYLGNKLLKLAWKTILKIFGFRFIINMYICTYSFKRLTSYYVDAWRKRKDFILQRIST